MSSHYQKRSPEEHNLSHRYSVDKLVFEHSNLRVKDINFEYFLKLHMIVLKTWCDNPN